MLIHINFLDFVSLHFKEVHAIPSIQNIWNRVLIQSALILHIDIFFWRAKPFVRFPALVYMHTEVLIILLLPCNKHFGFGLYFFSIVFIYFPHVITLHSVQTSSI
ncbi:unnamed protein product, partial [Musa hybrid cultivar]